VANARTKNKNKNKQLTFASAALAPPIARLARMGNPSIMTMANSQSSMRVSHREYIQDLVSSTSALAVTEISLNPGLSATFPWLSNIAQNFDRYKWHSLRFYYRSLSATALNSTNTALGFVILTTQFDTYDPAFTAKQQMEIVAGAVSASPDQCMVHEVDVRRVTSLPQLFVRSGGVPTGADSRLYDVGVTSVGVGGSQAVANIGELWVEYEVEFYQPRLAFDIELSGFAYNHTNIVPTTANGLAGHAEQDRVGLVTTFVTTTSPQTITITGVPLNWTIFAIYRAAAVTTFTMATAPVFSSGTANNSILADSTANNHANHSEAGSTTATYASLVSGTVNAASIVYSITAPGTVTGACFGDVFIYAFPGPLMAPKPIKLPIGASLDQVRTLHEQLRLNKAAASDDFVQVSDKSESSSCHCCARVDR
jgi:hypothetical protein